MKIHADIFFLYIFWNSFVYLAGISRSRGSTSQVTTEMIFMFLESVEQGDRELIQKLTFVFFAPPPKWRWSYNKKKLLVWCQCHELLTHPHFSLSHYLYSHKSVHPFVEYISANSEYQIFTKRTLYVIIIGNYPACFSFCNTIENVAWIHIY